MYIIPFTFRQFSINSAVNQKDTKTYADKTAAEQTDVDTADAEKTNELCKLAAEFCKTFKLPDEKSNHANFDEKLVQKIASYRDDAAKPVVDMLKTADNEKDITAGLFLLNRIIDAGAKNVSAFYHVISKFNYSDSPNVQTMLAGVYRKTQVPDAFGPLMTMFLKNAQNPAAQPFDPNEEIGGAILEYLRNKSSVYNYSSRLHGGAQIGN